MRGRGAGLRRSAGGRHRADGIQDQRAPSGVGGRGAGGARRDAGRSIRSRHPPGDRAHRPSRLDQSVGRRWRQRHAPRARAVGDRRVDPGRAARGGGRVQRRHAVRRAADRAPAARRGPDFRRRSRPGPPSLRARLLDAAAAPEGDRGEPVAGADPGAARRHNRGGGRGRARRALPQRRHHRVHRRGQRVLFPRDEHAPAGRAPGHRTGHRPRPRARADPRRQRRAATVDPAADHPAWARDRSAPLRRRSSAGVPAAGRPAHPLPRAPAPRHPRRLRRRRGGRGLGLL